VTSERNENGKPLVLVADDDPDILALVSFRLERAGYDVLGAKDGEEALRLALDRAPFSPQELGARVQAILGRR
jgi:DNA-binding response OmpR family regulator